MTKPPIAYGAYVEDGSGVIGGLLHDIGILANGAPAFRIICTKGNMRDIGRPAVLWAEGATYNPAPPDPATITWMEERMAAHGIEVKHKEYAC